MQPLVSIIVVSHNRANMVTHALDSVYEQTYRPLELVVVDDGSTDNSWDVITAWQKTHPDTAGFTSIVKTFPNGKIAASRIRGLDMANGELIQYVDDDDWLLPECVARKVARFESDSRLDVVVHQMTLLQRGRRIGRSSISIPQEAERQLEHLLDVNTETLIVPVLMMRKRAMLAVGGWTPGQNFAEDMDITFRMAANGSLFSLVDEELSVYNMHGEERLCTTLVYNLPDDFWVTFLTRFFDFCKDRGCDMQMIASKIQRKLIHYGKRNMRLMRFNACELCFDGASKVCRQKCFWGASPRLIRYVVIRVVGTSFFIYNFVINQVKKLIRAILK